MQSASSVFSAVTVSVVCRSARNIVNFSLVSYSISLSYSSIRLLTGQIYGTH